MPAERVSIVVLCHNRWAETRRCLDSVRRNTDRGSYELLAVDNASEDGTFARLRALARGWPELQPVRNGRNLPFAKAVNRAMRAGGGTHVVWLNNDTVVTRGWLSGLLAALRADPAAGAAGPMTDGLAPTLQLGRSSRGVRPVETPFLGGFCFLVSREALESAGVLDERFIWGWEDMDCCLRLRQAGRKLLLVPGVFVRHAGSRTLRTWDVARRRRTDRENRRLIRAKWSGAEPYAGDLAKLMEDLPSPWPERGSSVSVAVLSRGPGPRLRRCLEALAADAGPMRTDVRVTAVGRSWPRAVNAALARARGELVALLDEGTAVRPGWLPGLARALRAADNGGAAAPLARGARLPWQAAARRASGRAQSVHHFDGFCVLLSRRALEGTGRFDDRFSGRDAWADYNLRLIQAGFQLFVARGVVVEHDARPEALPPEERARDRRLLLYKWAGHPLLAEGLRRP